MAQEFGNSTDKSAGQLGVDALRFTLHTFIAVVALAVVVSLFALAHPQDDANNPKLF